jgi:hypothetical protein
VSRIAHRDARTVGGIRAQQPHPIRSAARAPTLGAFTQRARDETTVDTRRSRAGSRQQLANGIARTF